MYKTPVPTGASPPFAYVRFNRRRRRALFQASLSFFDAVTQACIRTLANIPCLVILAIMTAYVFFEYIEDVGPIEQFHQFLRTEQLSTANVVEKFLLKVLLTCTNAFITYKNKIFAILAFTPMVCLRPKKLVVFVYALVLIIVLALKSVSPSIYLSTAIFFWLHTQLDSEYHKALCVIASTICVAIWLAVARSNDTVTKLSRASTHGANSTKH